MTPLEVVQPLIDLDGGIAVGVFLVLGGMVANLMLRVGKMETDLKNSREYSRTLWAYCRALLDMYYRHRKDGSPEPGPLPDEP